MLMASSHIKTSMSNLTPPSDATFREAVKTKVVIVTGAAQGIGLGIAEYFAAGATEILADWSLDRIQAVADKIGSNAHPFQCNVSSWEDQLALFEFAISRFGKVDALVCNASIDPELISACEKDDPLRAPAMEDVHYNLLADQMETTDSDSHSATQRLRAPPNTILEVNVVGVIYGVKLAIHHMKKTGGGRIAIISSAASYYPVPDQSIYSASKHAILGLMRTVSKRADVGAPGCLSAWCALGWRFRRLRVL
jgi:NAD(P)-dependent dehydrogenase (short-subunit alcohol dehydrogenase family)